jgi:hypothetical protein
MPYKDPERAREYMRRYNRTEKRRKQIREWKEANRERVLERDRLYREEHRGTCERCGGPRGKGKGIPSVGPGLCRSCKDREVAEHQQRLVRFYEGGMSLNDMAAELGLTRNNVGVQLVYLRKAGRIGYRYKGYESKVA